MMKLLTSGVAALSPLAFVTACGDQVDQADRGVTAEERDRAALPEGPDAELDTMTTDDLSGDASSEAGERPTRSIVEIAAMDDRFSTLASLLEASGLASELSSGELHTVFAPTDAAFEALPAGTVEQLRDPANRDQLADLLRYHVASGRVTSADAIRRGQVDMLHGRPLVVEEAAGRLRVGGAEGAVVTSPDIRATNGVIHGVDAVLLPQG